MEHIKLCDVINVLDMSDDDIKQLQTKFLVSIIMERIVKFLLFRDDEGDFFDLTPYLREYKEKMEPVITRICSDIENLDYKTVLSYGKTALFIYKNEVPENCW